MLNNAVEFGIADTTSLMSPAYSIFVLSIFVTTSFGLSPDNSAAPPERTCPTTGLILFSTVRPRPPSGLA